MMSSSSSSTLLFTLLALALVAGQAHDEPVRTPILLRFHVQIVRVCPCLSVCQLPP
jgi:hypothetical protein